MRKHFSHILSVLLLIIISAACSSGEGRVKKSQLIPEKDLVGIMTELYITDGLLAFPPVRSLFSSKDSIANYIDVIKSHGYTKEQMDVTLKYYFIEKPKELENIYDQVLARLSEMQSRLESGPPSSRSANLWNQKSRLSVPEDGAHNLLYFSIPVKDTGLYELSFTALIYKDDKSLNPRASTYFWHSSDTQDGVKENWADIELIRDGARHTYSVQGRLRDTTFTHISGWLFQCDPQMVNWVKHGLFTSISVVRITRKVE